MKKLEPNETELIGEWISAGRGSPVRGNEACDRIQWLTSEILEKVGVDPKSAGWEKLFRDPKDGRYWLLTYPKSEMQGGGPPALRHMPLSAEEVKEKFVSVEEWNAHMDKFMRDRNITFIQSKDASDRKE